MASRPGSAYNTSAYRKAKTAFIAQAPPVCAWVHCPIPGRLIDKRLSGNHPLGATLDHIEPTSQGGAMWDTSNWSLVHRRCNTSKGDRTPEPRRTRFPW